MQNLVFESSEHTMRVRLLVGYTLGTQVDIAGYGPVVARLELAVGGERHCVAHVAVLRVYGRYVEDKVGRHARRLCAALATTVRRGAVAAYVQMLVWYLNVVAAFGHGRACGVARDAARRVLVVDLLGDACAAEHYGRVAVFHAQAVLPVVYRFWYEVAFVQADYTFW